MKISEFQVGIAIGIRFRLNLKFENAIGEVIDNMLYRSQSYFSPERFPETEFVAGGKRLINRSTADQIQIDTTDVILDINFVKDGFCKENEKDIVDNYKNDIIDYINKNSKIEQIARIGIVKKYLLPNDMYKNLVENTLNTKDDIQELVLSFQKRMVSTEAIAKKEINDYKNAIYNIKKRKSDTKISTTIDYQYYFDPPLIDLREVEYQKFVNDANLYIENDFNNWIGEKVQEA